ncbi:hypothetical protein B0J12DRAFT_693003 [Macrophomina phaseolina]|uniref:Secreted protein n=1 Tax=Macrophomina phaseolina TaxID=35725 RepID=A0ABQ8GTH8_9PEZI|nr:hypothetical protein B0J12DRAFT_693003 [Macrophomina phaseolina]
MARPIALGRALLTWQLVFSVCNSGEESIPHASGQIFARLLHDHSNRRGAELGAERPARNTSVPHDRLGSKAARKRNRCEVAANNKRSAEERSSDPPASTQRELRERPSVSREGVKVKSSWRQRSKS